MVFFIIKRIEAKGRNVSVYFPRNVRIVGDPMDIFYSYHLCRHHNRINASADTRRFIVTV